MERLGRSASLSVCGIALVLMPAVPAAAGAWTQAPGEGLVIGTTARRAAPVGALAGGVADSDANSSQLYIEYGLIEGLTVGAKFYSEISTSNFEASSASFGGFLRKRVWRDGHGGIASLQGGYAHPIESLIGNGMELAEPGAVPEAHLAGLYGRGWGGDWGSAFLSTGAAYHWRGEGLAAEVRGEVTGGYAPWPDWMGMLGLHGLYPLADGTDRSLKIAPSIGYTYWPDGEADGQKSAESDASEASEASEEPGKPVTIQLGVSYDLLNRQHGIGVFVSLWQRF